MGYGLGIAKNYWVGSGLGIGIIIYYIESIGYYRVLKFSIGCLLGISLFVSSKSWSTCLTSILDVLGNILSGYPLHPTVKQKVAGSHFGN